MIKDYYANGKIVISGEYMVLKGAAAIAVPVKTGQQLKVAEKAGQKQCMIRWTAHVQNKPWFYAEICPVNWEITEATELETAAKLSGILRQAVKINPHFIEYGTHYEILTNNGFPLNWGFGSSAALIANISKWADINPFVLLFNTLGGSGVDVAASLSTGPVLYRLVENKPTWCRIEFGLGFRDHLWLVYLGNKQNTHTSVAAFNENQHVSRSDINAIDQITQQMIDVSDLGEFMQLMHRHEEIIAKTLEVTPVKEMLFDDFQGEIKSLGAWGGDFVLVASNQEASVVKNYFENKGLYPIFEYKETVL